MPLIKFRTLILIFCLLIIATTMSFLVFKNQKQNHLLELKNIYQNIGINFDKNINISGKSQFSRIIYDKYPNTFSASILGRDEINLTKHFKVENDADSQLVANKSGSKIAFVSKDNKEFSVSIANSDGTNPIKIFNLERTLCDIVRVSSVSENGKVIIINYSQYEEGDGPSCIPKRKFVLEYGTYIITEREGKYIYFKFPKIIGGQENFEWAGIYEDRILFTVPDTAQGIKSVWQFNTSTEENIKLFTIPKEFYSNFSPHMELNTILGIVVLHIFHFENTKSSWSKIVVYDYINNKYDIVAQGGFTEFQGVKVSPNFKKLFYYQEINGIYKISSYIYDIYKKETKILPFADGKSHLSVHWIDDENLLYLWSQSLPPDNYVEIIKYNLITGEKHVVVKEASKLK